MGRKDEGRGARGEVGDVLPLHGLRLSHGLAPSLLAPRPSPFLGVR